MKIQSGRCRATVSTAASCRGWYRSAIGVDADLLVLLTDVEGLYTADPRTDPSARRIEPFQHGDAVSALVQRAHALQDVVELSGTVPVVEAGGERRPRSLGRVPLIGGQREGLKKIPQFSLAVRLIIVMVGDQGEFIDSQADGEQGLRPGEIVPRCVHAAGILLRAILLRL